MKKEDVILIAEDDKRHFELIKRNLLRAGINNKMICLADGREILDFLFDVDKKREREYHNQEYILLLDLSIPGVNGVEVLEKIKFIFVEDIEEVLEAALTKDTAPPKKAKSAK